MTLAKNAWLRISKLKLVPDSWTTSCTLAMRLWRRSNSSRLGSICMPFVLLRTLPCSKPHLCSQRISIFPRLLPGYFGGNEVVA